MTTSIKLSTLLALTLASIASAQGTKADYERANKLRDVVRDTVFRDQVEPHWVDDHHFWYRVRIAKDQHEFVIVNAEKGKRELAFDHKKLAKQLGEQTNSKLEPNKLPFNKLRYFPGDDSIEFEHKGHWKLTRADGKLAKLKNDEPRKETKQESAKQKRPPNTTHRQKKSPDGKWEVFIKDHDLWLRPHEKNDEAKPLTTDGTEKDGYRNGNFYWSPDSKKLIALRTKRGQEHPVSFVESAPKDQTQPKLHTFHYLKPGDEIPQSKPHLFDIETQKEIPVKDDLFPNPWLDRPRIEWAADSSRCYYLYNQRGHHVLRVLAINAESGEVQATVNEESKTFVDYAYKKYLHFIHGKNELIWMSERSGWNHLYLIDAQTGDVKKPITKGDWVVRRVDRIDNEKRQIWFRASGINDKQDPYYIHHCRVDFDGSSLTMLTHGDGTHEVKYSANRKYLIDVYSRVDLPPITQLVRVSDGQVQCELERANWDALLKTGWKAPERFVAKARDGKTDIHGIIIRPTNFDDKKTYPIIEKIYAGPHSSFVPKRFRTYMNVNAVAELGFIVVQIDGLGTSNRSKAFHDVCWKNLGDSGFPDRILWIKAAAKKYPYMDTSRVGIFGGSAGGQSSTRAMLAFGDFYKVAVSDCGCHDNRMDKIWWNELWMSWPIGPHYKEQSNVTQAHRLKGKLFLTVGELDRNVDPASTMQVVSALIKAEKDFDLLVVPGAGHGVGESPYMKRRRRDYFVRHLMGVEPRR